MKNETDFINNYLINSIKNFKETPRTRFFKEEDIHRLNNSNVLKFTDITLIENTSILETVWLSDVFGIDIETTGFDAIKDNIVGIGLSDGVRHYYINIPSDATVDYIECISLKLEELIDNAKYILAHNAKFEYKFLKRFLGLSLPLDKTRDTMVMAYLLDYPLKLSKLAEECLKRFPLSWKDLTRENGTDNAYDLPVKEISRYCCEDALECVLLDRVFKSSLDVFYNNKIPDIDYKNSITTGELELTGICIDKEEIPKLINHVTFLQSVYIDEFINLSGREDININSPLQVSKLLYEELKLPTEGIKRGDSGNYSVDKASLNELDGLHPIINTLQDYSVVTKVKSFLVSKTDSEKGLINLLDELNQIYPNTNNALTKTGRYSMSNPNLQQMPSPARYKGLKNKELAELGTMVRNLFICRKSENWFVIADYPSFEFRILASISHDKTLEDVFINGKDFHIIICEKLFNISYDKANPQHAVFRQVTKTINYGVAYGMTWIRLQRECLKVGLSYSKEKCLEILADYWLVLDGVYSFFCREKLRALKHGYSQTLWGRKRFYQFSNWKLKNWVENNLSFFSIDGSHNQEVKRKWESLVKENIFTYQDESNFRTIQNNPLQGTNADVVRNVTNELTEFCMIKEQETGLFCKLVLTVHDEFIVECHYNLIPVVTSFLKGTMENSIELSVPLPIHPVVCKKWGEGK